ncbi:MAG: hypothetical protein ACE5GO_09535 [Anaerolineales bacterium]
MRGCARFITSILAIALILTLPLSLLIFNIGSVVFNRELAKNVLTEIVTESDLIPAALEWYSERRAQQRVDTGVALPNVDEPDIVQLMDFMALNDWRDIKTEVLTDEILTGWVSITVDGVYDWLDSEDRVPQITWEMKPFIDQVNTDHGVHSIEIAYNTLPPCTEEQIKDFKTRLAAAPPGTEVLYNLCEFPDPWREDQLSDYLESLQDLVENIPVKFELTQETSQAEDPEGVGPKVLKAQLQLLRTIYPLVLLVPATLLLLILLVGIRSLTSLSRWWGIPLTLGGLFSLILTLVYRPVVTALLASGPLSEVPSAVQTEAIQAILQLAAEVFRPMLIQSLVIAVVIGLDLVIVGGVIGRRQGNKKVSAVQ